MCDLNDGIDVKRYLDKIPFNFTKRTRILEKEIKQVYDRDTLGISVTRNPTWGENSSHDESYDFSDGRTVR